MTSVALGDLMPSRIPSVDPAKYPDETFELWSIPAFDAGAPEVVKGGQIGSQKKCVEPDDVLLSRIVPHIRRSCVVGSYKGIRQVASGEWITFRDPRFYPPYLRHMLTSDPFHAEFMQTVAGVGGSLLRARPEGVKSIKIPLPPLEEQKRIAAILDQADALRRLRRRALDRLNTLGQAIFHEMFGASKADGWPVVSLGELAINCDGSRIPLKKEDRSKRSGTIPYYGASGIIDYIDDFIFEGPHLLIGEDGANLLARSSPVAFMADGKFWVNNHAHVLKANKSAELEYLKYFVEAIDLEPYITGSAQPKLNQKQLNRIPIVLPPLDLQSAFVNAITVSDKERSGVALACERSERLFTSLQHRAFRGEL